MVQVSLTQHLGMHERLLYRSDILFPVLLTGIVAAIGRWLPQLSGKTTTLLRSQLPRPRLMKQLLVPGIVQGDEDKAKMEREYQDFVKLGLEAGAQNAMFVQGAWQMLALVAVQVEDEHECARRGCQKKAVDAEDQAEFVCGMCKVTNYCSMTCLERYVVISWTHGSASRTAVG